MNPRTTLMLLVVAAALGAFVYFYEIRGGEVRKQAEEDQKRLFHGIEQEEIGSISLRTQDGVAARVERRDDGWYVAEPIDFPGDEFSIDAMAAALAQIASERVLDDPQPPDVYGLGGDAQEVRFRAGEREFTLRLGNKTPVGASSYAATGGTDRVYTVPTTRVNSFGKTLDDLREKRVLQFDRETISRIEARWPQGGVVLERGNAGWALVEPVAGLADEAAVDGLLSDLSFLRATGFVDDPPPDAEAGLEPPEFEVSLISRGDEGGSEPGRLRVAFGSSPDGESRLVRSGQPSLYRIPAERLSDLPREVVAYRFKELARFSAIDARRVEIEFQRDVSELGAEGPLRVAATRDDSGWSSEPERMKPGRIASLVAELARLRGVDIAADAMGPDELAGLRLDPPNARYTVLGEELDDGVRPKLAEVRIGVTRGNERIYAQAEGNDTVFELDYAVAEHLPVNLEAFLNRFVSGEDEEVQFDDEEIPSDLDDELLTPEEESP
jgi:hypothetical protein